MTEIKEAIDILNYNFKVLWEEVKELKERVEKLERNE